VYFHGSKGNITTGNGETLPNTHRDSWAIPSDTPSSAQPRGRHSDSESGRDQIKIRRDRSAVFEVCDLAFANNEHLLPINHFATEQGMVQSKTRASQTGGSGRSEAARIGGGLQVMQYSLLDTALNETADGFSAKEVCAGEASANTSGAPTADASKRRRAPTADANKRRLLRTGRAGSRARFRSRA
jgi:hypothetical protein